jgi:hypothetical protein
MRCCCVWHDFAYWAGGPPEMRAAADRRFRECILHRSRYKWLAWVRWFGVRAGGVGWLPTPFRWGYGWRWPVTDGVGGPFTVENQRAALEMALRRKS